MKDNEPHLFIFFSVDIINSTKLKYDKENNSEWFNSFCKFYDTFPNEFNASWDREKTYRCLQSDNKIEVWKYVGDEILFYYEITKENEVPSIITSFKSTLEKWNSSNTNKLSIKGCSWIGQTPFIDRIVDKDGKRDFIGISVDCGFRIGKFASEDELVISVEIADLCKSSDLKIYFLKTEKLKGVFQDLINYPIFLIKLDAPKENSVYKYLRAPCLSTNIDYFIDYFYKNVESEFDGKNICSRINYNICEYIKSKEKESEFILQCDSEYSDVIEGVSKETSDNTNTSNEILSEINNIQTNVNKQGVPL